MPKSSIRQQTIKNIEYLIRECIAEDKHEEAEELIDLLWGMKNNRVLNNSASIPKLTEFRNYIPLWDDEEFINIFRLEKAIFWKLVKLIENNRVFSNKSRLKQADVNIQLAVTLKRLSHDGTANSVNQLAGYFGISIGSVNCFTNRCFSAIKEELGQMIHWPNKEQRALTSSRIQYHHYFRNCIGYLDRTHFRLSQKPTVDGETYFNRKGFYSLNCQIICDERMVIFGIQLGNPGSVSDATCVNDAVFLRNQNDRYFSTDGNHEYLLGDSGYALHPFVLTPYRRPQVVASQYNHDFNLIHSSARVAVENAIGVLKGRWRFIKNIPFQLNQPKDITRIDEAVSVCAILHNFLIIEHDRTKVHEAEEEIIGQSEEEVITLTDLDRGNTRSNVSLNRWRDSVRDVVLSDHIEEYDTFF